jgi:hypothetical protein
MANDEFRVPFLFSWPPTAHTGYFENEVVLDLLVCGMENGAVSKPCTSPAR